MGLNGKILFKVNVLILLLLVLLLLMLVMCDNVVAILSVAVKALRCDWPRV